jgi:hypothetical protein
MSYNIVMSKILALILGCSVFFGLVTPVFAASPVLELVAQGRSVESAGGWGTDVNARPGDVFLLWFVVKNTAYGTVATNAKVKVDMPNGEANPLVLTVHATADGANSVEQKLTISLNGPASTISYIPGGDAVVITNGVNTKITPDQAGANMTTQYVNIGNINGGDFSYAKVLGTTKIAPRETAVPTITPTNTPSVASASVSASASATASAVANTTPDTGVNEVMWSTLMWLGVGVSGYSIRKWASKRSV